MEDWDVCESRMSESAQRVVNRAFEDARRRHQSLVNAHVFVAFAEVESDAFAVWMREVGVDPDDIAHAIRQHLDIVAPDPHADVRVSPATKLLFKLAFHHASRRGRSYFGAIDMFAAIFDESQDAVTAIVRRYGAEPEAVIMRGRTALQDFERREEQLEQERRAEAANWAGPLIEEVEPRSVRQRFLDLIGLRRRTRG